MKKLSGTLTLPMRTQDGAFLAHYSTDGLCGLDFPGASKKATVSHVAEVPVQVQSWHQQTKEALERALAGKPVRKLPPLDLSCGTEFQRKVWNKLAKIAVGKTLSYAQVAAAIRSPRASRAVGGACGANPIPVLVPCHRVLAANQKIGGFSGGLNWKVKLLEREGVPVNTHG